MIIRLNNSHNCNAYSMKQKMSLKDICCDLKLLLTLAKLKIDFRILNILKVNIAFNMQIKIDIFYTSVV
ncbi:hypothetical protein T06_8452 [Trichinella sp. T6]|nr:hypothetical protein T06_8452 [Trichinella sp. T6]